MIFNRINKFSKYHSCKRNQKEIKVRKIRLNDNTNTCIKLNYIKCNRSWIKSSI